MNTIILEDANGNRRTVEAGRQIKPPRRPGEKIILQKQHLRPFFDEQTLRMCSNCKMKGVYEYT